MRLKNITRSILFTICFFVVGKSDAQFSDFSVIDSSKRNDTTPVYYLLGEACPVCPYLHSMEFGFKITCSCNVDKADIENNEKVAHKLNLKYGRGWLEKFLQENERCEMSGPPVIKLPYYLTLNIETYYQLDSVRVYEVFDNKGISVQKGRDKMVDVSSLAQGFYYLVLDETEMKEFVKNK